MHVIEAFNVRDALPKAVALVMEHGIVEETRLGPVVAAAEPVAIHYMYPKNHVLLNPITGQKSILMPLALRLGRPTLDLTHTARCPACPHKIIG